MFVAIRISAVKEKKTELFPYGQFVYEALYALLKGLMIAGVLLVSIRFIDLEGAFGFFHYIGDSLLVLLLCVILGKDPILLIRNSFIEIAGGTLQNKGNKQLIEKVLQKYLSQVDVQQKNYISKTGSSYLVVAYLNIQSITAAGSEKIEELRQQIHAELQKNFPNVMFEIVLS